MTYVKAVAQARPATRAGAGEEHRDNQESIACRPGDTPDRSTDDGSVEERIDLLVAQGVATKQAAILAPTVSIAALRDLIARATTEANNVSAWLCSAIRRRFARQPSVRHGRRNRRRQRRQDAVRQAALRAIGALDEQDKERMRSWLADRGMSRGWQQCLAAAENPGIDVAIGGQR